MDSTCCNFRCLGWFTFWQVFLGSSQFHSSEGLWQSTERHTCSQFYHLSMMTLNGPNDLPPYLYKLGPVTMMFSILCFWGFTHINLQLHNGWYSVYGWQLWACACLIQKGTKITHTLLNKASLPLQKQSLHYFLNNAHWLVSAKRVQRNGMVDLWLLMY